MYLRYVPVPNVRECMVVVASANVALANQQRYGKLALLDNGKPHADVRQQPSFKSNRIHTLCRMVRVANTMYPLRFAMYTWSLFRIGCTLAIAQVLGA